MVAGKRLTSISGGNRETLKVTLPEDQIKPNSRIQVNFRLDPRERRSCSRVTDQQLWSTIHSDTEFKLNREQVVRLPDLELLRAGYPFAAPQDLSSTAIASPKTLPSLICCCC
ncbi:MAG: cellulose biosynthesis cyclic di-GMP-binding regulatory protein BcsB [Leptolyngbyaceae cyanobacterium SL_5_14]|nr:cellulose biosynthesis cyclic di-GMP-binding regulatory protein BcsB [Leptolyngbyaceae cyanobacterium SL_5_14]